MWVTNTAMEPNFNPRSRKGSDHSAALRPSRIRHFNPRSRKGSDPWPGRVETPCRNFNPRSRKGSDIHDFHDYNPTEISIHAPVKGATATLSPIIVVPTISIHAPVKGATWLPLMVSRAALFQSTLP